MFTYLYDMAIRLWEKIAPFGELVLDWFATGIELPGYGNIAPINFLLGTALTIWLGLKFFKLVVTLS